MLLVRTKIGQSPIHGIGLFADQFIPKGTPIWKHTPGFDRIITQEELAQLSESSRAQMLNYCYINKSGNLILNFDDARFVNHSDVPNMYQDFIADPEGVDTASRDIQPGEELTENYYDYDRDAHRKLAGKSTANPL